MNNDKWPSRVKINIGTKIGNVTCISREYKNPTSKKRTPALYITVKCDCGIEFSMTKHQFLDGKLTKKRCKSCGRKNSANKHKNGYGQVSGSYLSSLRAGAKKRNIKFEITAKDIWSKFLAQNGCCALSGISLIMTYDGKRNSTNTASLDRIDSDKNYTIDNVQWIHKDINSMKLGMKDKDLINYCYLISEYNKEKRGEYGIHTPLQENILNNRSATDEGR